MSGMEMTALLMEYLLILVSLGVYVYIGSLIVDTLFSAWIIIEQDDRII